MTEGRDPNQWTREALVQRVMDLELLAYRLRRQVAFTQAEAIGSLDARWLINQAEAAAPVAPEADPKWREHRAELIQAMQP